MSSCIESRIAQTGEDISTCSDICDQADDLDWVSAVVAAAIAASDEDWECGNVFDY